MRAPRALLVIAALSCLLAAPAPGAGQTRPISTPPGGIQIAPDEQPLMVAGCAITPRAPEERDGLIRALAGFSCGRDGKRRDVTIELWQRDDSGFWQPVYATDETYATTPGLGAIGKPLPMGPDEISCRATPLGVFRQYRTYAAAFGSQGEPLLHAGPVSSLPRDCLAGMAEEHLRMLGLPPDSPDRQRLPPMDQLSREAWFAACPALMLSLRPWKPDDCPG